MIKEEGTSMQGGNFSSLVGQWKSRDSFSSLRNLGNSNRSLTRRGNPQEDLVSPSSTQVWAACPVLQKEEILESSELHNGKRKNMNSSLETAAASQEITSNNDACSSFSKSLIESNHTASTVELSPDKSPNRIKKLQGRISIFDNKSTPSSFRNFAPAPFVSPRKSPRKLQVNGDATKEKLEESKDENAELINDNEHASRGLRGNLASLQVNDDSLRENLASDPFSSPRNSQKKIQVDDEPTKEKLEKSNDHVDKSLKENEHLPSSLRENLASDPFSSPTKNQKKIQVDDEPTKLEESTDQTDELIKDNKHAPSSLRGNLDSKRSVSFRSQKKIQVTDDSTRDESENYKGQAEESTKDTTRKALGHNSLPEAPPFSGPHSPLEGSIPLKGSTAGKNPQQNHAYASWPSDEFLDTPMDSLEKKEKRRGSLNARINIFNNNHTPRSLAASTMSQGQLESPRKTPRQKHVTDSTEEATPVPSRRSLPQNPLHIPRSEGKLSSPRKTPKQKHVTDSTEGASPVQSRKSLPDAPLVTPTTPAANAGEMNGPSSRSALQKRNSIFDRINKFERVNSSPAGLGMNFILSPPHTRKKKTAAVVSSSSDTTSSVSPRASLHEKSSLSDARASNKKLPLPGIDMKYKKVPIPDIDVKNKELPHPDTDTERILSPKLPEEDRDATGSLAPHSPKVESDVASGEPGALFSPERKVAPLRERMLMFNKACAPPSGLMSDRAGVLSPKHTRKLIVKGEKETKVDAEKTEKSSDAKETDEDESKAKPRISLDKQNTKKPDEKKDGALSDFRDRRDGVNATKSALLGQKLSPEKDVFRACTARVEDFSSFQPPNFYKEPDEIRIIKSALKKNFVFDDLNEDDIERFVAAFQKVDVVEGATIIKQGDVGDFFYVIAYGGVSLHVNNKKVGSLHVNNKKVGSTQQVNSFGELSLLHNCPRDTTVKAETQRTSLFRVDEKTFRYMMQSQTKKLEEAKEKLVRGISFLAHLGDEDIHRLWSCMTPCLFSAGDYVVRKGEQGASFYILQEGRVRATDIFVGNTSYDDVTLHPGDYFGESALISTEPRASNVVALTNGTAFSIDRETCRRVLGDFATLLSQSGDRMRLEGIKVFKDSDLTSADFKTLAKHIVDKEYDENGIIFHQNDDIEAALYIVREGVVKISTKDGSPAKEIRAGGYFGGGHLLADSHGHLQGSSCMIPADFTATVSGDKCVCGILKLEHCRTVFDTTSMLDAAFDARTSSVLNKRASVRLSVHANVGLNDLTRSSVLGEGQFGEVWLVKADPSGLKKEDCMQEFALKIQSKDDPVRKDNVTEAIEREVTVIKQLNHPFIIDLIETYECEESIYMLMEAVKGGELWSIIHQENEDGEWTSGLTETHAKFYSLILAETLTYMHRQKFIFRDLKPENVLIDREGYPIIVDFGFAKYCPDKTYTFCGTPNYLAPEIVMNRGHGVGVDHWALGVVTYEMITGENPFYHEGMDQMTVFEAIVQEQFYPLPETKSPELQDFMSGLLEKDPAQRLGMLSGRAKDILKHKWFDGLDLAVLRNKEAKAPWIPPL